MVPSPDSAESSASHDTAELRAMLAAIDIEGDLEILVQEAASSTQGSERMDELFAVLSSSFI